VTVRAVADERARLRLQPGGTLNPRRHIYIERPEDRILLKLLLEGQYVNILTSRQMGKSSLMVRTAEALTQRGVRCAIVDLAAELGTPADATAYFQGLLHKIARDLKIEVDLQVWWSELAAETVNQRLMRFFREVVCEQVGGAVVVFLDEIDSTLKLPWTDDLFTALRGMYNERPLLPVYERLAFCLIGVAAPNELIKDRRSTPYNAGHTIELGDFDLARDDLTPLEAALSAEPGGGRRLIERVLYWTGGHPYITVRVCAALREIGATRPDDVDARVEDAFRNLDRVTNDVHVQQVLRFLEMRLSDGLATFRLYEKILEGARERDQPTLAYTELKLSGLVKRDPDGFLIVRNRIYERLFDRKWVESSKPRRALRTYRRYAIAACIALLIGAVGAGGYIKYLQMRLGERQQLEALNVSITPAQIHEGIRTAFPESASQEVLKQAAPLLKAIDSVTELSFQRTPASDVAPLAITLPHLQRLELSGTEVSDVSPLATLASLRGLDLWDARVSDVSPLAKLTNLQGLFLTGTPVSDVSPLATLTNLRELSLASTPVSDVSPLARLTKLQKLALAGTQVSDAAPLATLTNLQVLSIAGTPVSDAAPLANLNKLRELYLVGTQVSDVAPLATLDNLEVLFLTGTPISYMAPLANLTNLQVLDLEGTKISDVAPLAPLTRLQALNLNVTKVSDVAPLATLTRLQRLNLNVTQVSNVAPLASLASLQELYLSITRVSDVASLARLTHLRQLDLEGTKVSDVAPLAKLTNLQGLNLSVTPVSNVAPLAKLINLQKLALAGTQVSNVSPLANLTNLQELDLQGTQVSDVAPLANLTNLRRLDLRNTQVYREAVDQLRKAVQAPGSRGLEIVGP
jgi:Leucine-rich repeat (LRR) protein